MKTKTKTLVAVIVACTLVSGCAAARKLYTPTPAAPVTVSQPILGMTTNNGVPMIDIIGYTNITTRGSNYMIAPVPQKILDVGTGVATFLPPPWNTVALTGLAGLSTILAAWGRKLSGQNTTKNAIIESVIAGVETANSLPTKAAIQNAAIANGVAGELHAAVKQLTPTPPPQS